MTNVLDKFGVNKEKLADQTEDSGGFDYEPPAAGPCVARFVGYIETGKQPQRPRQGKPQAPCEEAILEFQLLGKKHAKEIEITGEDGKTVKKTIYPIHREIVQVKHNHKSNSYKLLQAMDYGRGNSHFSFMLGEGFKINIVHNEVEKEGKKTVYANIRTADGAWTVGAPVIEKTDEEGELVTQNIAVPEPQGVELRLLLQDDPNMTQWNSIFIEGSYTKKDDKNNEVEVSKNWLQEKCMKAVDFEGSALQTMLLEAGGDLPDLSPDVMPDSADSASESDAYDVLDETGGEDTPEEKPAAAPAETASKPAASDEEDPLADLGL